ncbi:MAG: ADP-glyceromanno-heptose 6-epimerase [Endomicrobiia bacterium]
MKELIIVTGGAGFIGSAIVWKLNKEGITDIIIVDEVDNVKWKNLVGLKFLDYIEKDDFLENIKNGSYDRLEINTIFHMGACSSTTHPDARYYIKNNFEYTKILCKFAIKKNIRFIYASSAATYGDGSLGFSDDEDKLELFKPLNMYGYSKHLFDLWAKNNKLLDKIVGLKYFNVYGPNEYHKGDMRSFVVKAFEQIKSLGKVRLFKSYLSEYKDGEQLRDFIYIKDAVEMTFYFYENKNLSGIYNIGTGQPHSFNQLVYAVFKSLNLTPQIEYIDMPENIKKQYQYYTKAEMNKLFSKGYKKPITDFDFSIDEYVKKYISQNKYLADYKD